MISKLKIWQKLGLVFLLMSIPIGTFLFLFVSAKRVEVHATQEEAKGLEYLTALRRLLEHVPEHRSVVMAVLAGETTLKSRTAELESAIESDFAAVDGADAKYGPQHRTIESLRELKRSWSDLRSRVLTLAPRDAFDLHTKFAEDIVRHTKLVGDRFGLTTDPDLDTYYLANSLLVQTTAALESIGQLRAYGTNIAARRTGPEEQAQLQLLLRLVRASSDSARRNLRAGFDNNPSLEPKLGPLVGNAIGASEGFILLSSDKLLKGALTPKQYLDAGAAPAAEYLKLYDQTLAETRDLLDARITRLNNDQVMQLALAAAVVLLSMFVVFIINRAIARQVTAIDKLFAEIKAGNYTARAQVYSEDELGSTAASLNVMLDNTATLIQSREERDQIQESIQKLLDEISGVADGDLTAEAEVTSQITGAIADSFNMMIVELREIIRQVQDTTLQVTTSAYEVRMTAEQLASGSESQSAQILEAGQAINEMATSIERVSQSAAAAAAVAEKALQNARQGAESVQRTILGMTSIRQHVQQTAKRMKRLGESSQEINEILQLIGDITERTGILALNASIKAANAGPAGKDFATVAAEVEQLAERSTQATKRISALIKSIQSDTNEAISAMEETTKEVVGGSNLANVAGQNLEQIESVSKDLAQLIQSIKKASLQQSSSSNAVTRSMDDISQVTQLTAVGAQQAARSIRELAEKATELRQSLHRFKLPPQEHEEAVV